MTDLPRAAYDRFSGHNDDEEEPVVSDKKFMENVRAALINGYDRVCAHCGVSTATDDMDIHERACPEFDERQLR